VSGFYGRLTLLHVIRLGVFLHYSAPHAALLGLGSAVSVRWKGCCIALLLLPLAALAADPQELELKLQNPIATLVHVPFQANYDCCYGASNGQLWYLNIEPIVPFRLTENWNLITRSIVPVKRSESLSADSGSEVGLGDIKQEFFFSPVSGPDLIWGVGPILLYPTATTGAFAAKRWAAGPTAALIREKSGWTSGFLAYHLWSFAAAGREGKPVNRTYVEPFLAYTMPGANSVRIDAEATYDWLAHQWSVPLNLTASHVFQIGGRDIRVQTGPRYYVETVRNGPRWGGRLTISFVFPRSW
jgi:hypothetical protein